MKSLFVALNFFNSCTTTSSNLDGDYDGRLEVQYGLVSRINCHDTETILVSFTSPPDSDIRSVGSGRTHATTSASNFLLPSGIFSHHCFERATAVLVLLSWRAKFYIPAALRKRLSSLATTFRQASFHYLNTGNARASPEL
jgi:hypothetical protein